MKDFIIHFIGSMVSLFVFLIFHVLFMKILEYLGGETNYGSKSEDVINNNKHKP